MAGKGNPNWVKGQSANPSGRPEGCKNKNYVDPKFWSEKLIECYERSTPKEQVELAKWYLTLLFSKMQILPKTSEESVENVNEILGAIKTGIVKVENANAEAEPGSIPSGH